MTDLDPQEREALIDKAINTRWSVHNSLRENVRGVIEVALAAREDTERSEHEPCDYCKMKERDWTPECEENKALAAREELPEGFRDEDIEKLRVQEEHYRQSRGEGDYAAAREEPILPTCFEAYLAGIRAGISGRRYEDWLADWKARAARDEQMEMVTGEPPVKIDGAWYIDPRSKTQDPASKVREVREKLWKLRKPDGSSGVELDEAIAYCDQKIAEVEGHG